MKVSALGLAFLTELVMFAVFGLVGYQIQFVLAIALPLLVIGFWGFFMAPKSSRRLEQPLYTLAKLSLYGLTTALLGVFVELNLAIVFALMAAISEILLKLIGQSRTQPLD